jgi:octaprenyl-diphosphate synthase
LNQQEIYKLVEDGIVGVEQEIARQSGSNIQLVNHISRYIQNSGGKKIRPTLLLLTSRMCGFDDPVCHRLGAVLELIHAATLVHDDIIDNASVRRGRPSVNARWGNEITVLMGDWLYMTSFNLALCERHFAILDILTDVTRKMIEGELIQLSLNGSLDVTEEQHLDISMRKTAVLFSACTQIGGILGSMGDERQELLRLYGLHLGMAFQVVDDLLDFTSTESALGKPVGSDLNEGKLTLPIIYLMRDSEPSHRDLVRKLLTNGDFDTAEKAKIVSLFMQYQTLEKVLDKAKDYAVKAKEFIADFPPGLPHQALMAIPDYIVRRDH